MGLLAGPCLCVGLGASQSARAERVVYVNFDPTTLTDANGQDPTTDSFSSTGFSPGPISGWPELTAQQRAEMLYLLREATVPFDIVFTDTRPASGIYDMVVFGTQADQEALFPDSSCSSAISLADCEDGAQHNVNFVFFGCLSQSNQESMPRVAFTTLLSLGFGWGLEQVDVSGQVMGSFSLSGLRFGDSCVPVSGGGSCNHVGCPDGEQNSTADLLEHIGARVDDGPPTLVVTEPQAGAVVEPSFPVVAELDDAFGGLSATLAIVEADQSLTDTEPPFAWDLQNLPPGSWTIRVSGTDADDNVVTQDVPVCVQSCDSGGDSSGDGPSTGSDTEATSGSATSADASTSSTSSAASTSGMASATDPINPSAGFPGASGVDPAGGGCHCATSPNSRAHVMGWALLVAGLWARRRSARRIIPTE